MKIFVDYMPARDSACGFFKLINHNDNIERLCTMDNRPCDLSGSSGVPARYCRWLREHMTAEDWHI